VKVCDSMSPLGRPASGLSPDDRDFPSDKVRIRRQERDSVFETAVNWAIDPENGIDFVIIAGDLFETHTPDPALVEYVLSLLRRLEGAGYAQLPSQAITMRLHITIPYTENTVASGHGPEYWFETPCLIWYATSMSKVFPFLYTLWLTQAASPRSAGLRIPQAG